MVALTILIFTATSSVLSGLYSAPSAYAGGEYFVISESSAATIFSSRVSVDMIDALASMENITSASGEVFAFSSHLGVSFVVRGIGEGFGDAISPTAAETTWAAGVVAPDALPRSWAIVGSSLRERLGIDLPSTVPLVGSYSPKVEMVYVAGQFETGTSLDDELVVTNDVARRLSGMRDDTVSIIRVVTTEPSWLEELLSPRNARFALNDLTISKAKVAVGEELSVRVEVRNWGGSSGTTEVILSDGPTQLAAYPMSLNASSSVVLADEFVFDSLGNHTIIATVTGDFPVRLYANFSVIEPYLVIGAPARAALGTDFSAWISDYSGRPAAGASVQFQDQVVTADALGRANLTAVLAGSHEIAASLAGYLEASRWMTVLDPADYPDIFSPSIVSFSLQPSTIAESESAVGVVVLENNGTVAGSFEVIVSVDSVAWLSASVSLPGMSSAKWTFSLTSLSTGTHTVQVGNYSHALQVEAWYADDSDLLQLVLRYGGTSTLSTADQLPIYQAAKISEGNVAAALFSIGAVAGLLAVLAITSIFTKEIREHRRVMGVLRTVGASRGDMWRIVLPQALLYGLVGSAAGVLLGVGLVHLLSSSAVLMIFGHQLTIEQDLQLLSIVLASSVAIGIVSAVWSTDAAARTPPVAAIKNIDNE